LDACLGPAEGGLVAPQVPGGRGCHRARTPAATRLQRPGHPRRARAQVAHVPDRAGRRRPADLQHDEPHPAERGVAAALRRTHQRHQARAGTARAQRQEGPRQAERAREGRRRGGRRRLAGPAARAARGQPVRPGHHLG
jgi:hypothetical protein